MSQSETNSEMNVESKEEQLLDGKQGTEESEAEQMQDGKLGAGESEADVWSSLNEKGSPRNCDVCDIICGNEHAFDLHITGKGHQRALRLRENFEVLTDPESMKIVDNEPTILESLKAVDEPLIGLNYLIEFVPDDQKNDSSIIWVCVLCGSTLTSDTLVKEHFVGKRHRYRYLSKYYPDMSKQVHAKDKNSDKFSLCMSFAKEVEEKEGKKFESIQVAVNPNQSKVKDEGPPAKKKPVNLMDIKLPLMSGPPRFGAARFGPGPVGPGMSGPMMNGPGFPVMIPAPRTMAHVLPILADIEVFDMADRDCLIEASQILEQKLVDFNTYMGLDPYEGLQPYGGDFQQNAYMGQSQQIPSTNISESNTPTDVPSGGSPAPKGPVSLMDLPNPPMRGWPRGGGGGFQSF